MIPTADLLRLLDRIIHGDDLRADPDRLRRDDVPIVEHVEVLDAQSFATLARIAAGEAWENDYSGEPVNVPRSFLDERALMLAANFVEGHEHGYHDEARALRRLQNFARTL